MIPIDGTQRQSNALITIHVWQKREGKAVDKASRVVRARGRRHQAGDVDSSPSGTRHRPGPDGRDAAAARSRVGEVGPLPGKRGPPVPDGVCHAPTPMIEYYATPLDANGNAMAEQPLKLSPGSALKLSGDATFDWKQASTRWRRARTRRTISSRRWAPCRWRSSRRSGARRRRRRLTGSTQSAETRRSRTRRSRSRTFSTRRCSSMRNSWACRRCHA